MRSAIRSPQPAVRKKRRNPNSRTADCGQRTAGANVNVKETLCSVYRWLFR